MATHQLHPGPGDALIVVDMQNDFLPGGNLAVPEGDQAVEVMNGYLRLFGDQGLPIYATRDWHPPQHCSFTDQGGPWPPHCIAGSRGADFAPGLMLPEADRFVIISKGTEADREAYSGFQGTDMEDRLKHQRVSRVFVGGLALDVCVLETVRDALARGFRVVLLPDACRAVDVEAGDGQRAIDDMNREGALTATLDKVA